MMNPRYLQRFGEPPPFGDPIARAALRYDPKAPYGEPELEGTEGQRQFEPLDVQPSMNKGSLVAAAEPMSQPPVTAPPSAPMENPIVRAGRERAESVNDPYLDYDSEAPIRATRQSFQPPPTIESNALKSIVPPPDAPEIDSGRLPPPPVIDTRELPTAPPPESTMAMLIRQRLGNVLPDRKDYPVSKWAKLAAVALGAGQGYYNAANPNARPIDASEAVQNLTLGRKYIDAMGEYQRKRKDIGERIKLAGEAEDIESRIADRTETQASRKAANDERARQNKEINTDRDLQRQVRIADVLANLAKLGKRRVPIGDPVPLGMEVEYDPVFELGSNGQPAYKVLSDPHFGLVQVNAAQAAASGNQLREGQWVPLPKDPLGTVLGSAVKADPQAQENINHWVAIAADPKSTPEQKAIAEAKIKKYAATQQAVRVSVNAANPNLAPPQPVERGSKEYSVARDLASGNLTFSQFTKLFSRSQDANKRLAIYDAAREINSSFNPALFEVGYSFAKSPKVKTQIAALNNVDKGVDDLLKFSDKAGRSGVTILNKAIMPGGVALGNKNYTNFHTAQIAFADELSGALGYGNATDMAKQMGLDMTNPNFSPESFRSAINEVVVPFIARKRSSLTEQMGPYSQNQGTTENDGNAGLGRGGGGGGGGGGRGGSEEWVRGADGKLRKK